MRVLLVEDDKRIASFIRKGLRENAYAVDIATNGEDALYLSSINPYDLFILDINLPGINGFEVCRELREVGTSQPIMMLTARGFIEDKVAGLDNGADDYLTKPFIFKELLARLRALLRRRTEIRPELITAADLRIDTRSQTVCRAGLAVALTAKEYSLLEFLGLNKGRVVGRDEISNHVWDDNYDPFSNLIEVYVNRLRSKMDEGFDRQLIHTRRGAGYILDDV
ncbi:MAG TPA: response regulator transcription factor [Pyrinomonadaceae bacterium]|nr:response regulator transcription factor [Pyrinomonadaceae bacterium]